MDELRKNCRRSELSSLPTAECGYCGREVRATPHETQRGLQASPDPVYALSWLCPDEMCRGSSAGIRRG
jgi:hypothetical protein